MGEERCRHTPGRESTPSPSLIGLLLQPSKWSLWPHFAKPRSHITCQNFQNHTSDPNILLLKSLHSFTITQRVELPYCCTQGPSWSTFFIPIALNRLSFPPHLYCVLPLCPFVLLFSAKNNHFTSLPFPINSCMSFKTLKKLFFSFQDGLKNNMWKKKKEK